MIVIKRNGKHSEFDKQKIEIAVSKAMSRTEETSLKLPSHVSSYVESHIQNVEAIDVDEVHKSVENGLMYLGAFDVAREYITYRKSHMPDIFRERTAYKPFEYSELGKYVDAIQQSYWIVSEYNFTSDIQDFRATLPYEVREVLRKSMLSISQVEVSVKTFWSKVGDRFPKPEIQEVGAVFAESEVRHSRAYSHLLEVLGLNAEFDKIMEVPAIKKRVEYAKKAINKSKTDSNKDYMESVLLFSLFIENVSLFSQFLIISQTHKEMGGAIKGMATVVGATSLEEQIHASFGADIINIIRKENPEWFDDELQTFLHNSALEAFSAECDILDWIFSEGELEFLSKSEVIEYIKKRFNMGFVDAGFDPLFDIDESLLTNVRWFDVQNNSTSHQDFLSSRSGNYEKFNTPFDPDELF